MFEIIQLGFWKMWIVQRLSSYKYWVNRLMLLLEVKVKYLLGGFWCHIMGNSLCWGELWWPDRDHIVVPFLSFKFVLFCHGILSTYHFGSLQTDLLNILYFLRSSLSSVIGNLQTALIKCLTQLMKLTCLNLKYF